MPTAVDPRCLAAAPDGTLWALDSANPFSLIEVPPAGRPRLFSLPGALPSLPTSQCLVVGTDGNIWFADPTAQPTTTQAPFAAIARFDPSTHRTAFFRVPGTAADPQVLASGDGVVVFLDQKLNRIGEVDPNGTISELPQDGLLTLNDVLPVASGDLWVSGTDAVGPVLLELAPSGKVIHHVVASPGTVALVLGPDGHVWFSWGGGIGELTAALTPVNLAGNADDFPASVAADGKGRVWFASAYFGCLFSQLGYYQRLPRKAVSFHSTGCASDIVDGPLGIAYVTEQSWIYEVQGTAAPFHPTAATSRVSSISRFLPTFAEAFSPASSMVVSASIAAGLGIFLVFPSQLFNSTYQENYADISEWWKRRTRPITKHIRRREDRAARVTEDRRVFVAVILLGSLLSSLNDPTFGSSVWSIVTFLAVVMSVVAGVSLPAFVAGLYHQKRHGSAPRRLHTIPSGLAIAAGCVVFSRFAGFEPGYLYGVVAGVVFTRELPGHETGHVAALQTISTLLVCVLAWLCWAPVNHAADQPGSFFGLVLLADFLAAFFVSGVVGSLIAMLPIRLLPGYAVKQWSTPVWAGCYALCSFVLIQVLLRPSSRPGGPGHTPLVATVLLFVAAGAGSIAFHEHFEAKKCRLTGEPSPTWQARLRGYLKRPATSEPDVGSVAVTEPSPAGTEPGVGPHGVTEPSRAGTEPAAVDASSGVVAVDEVDAPGGGGLSHD
jgi:streptogramin lyase